MFISCAAITLAACVPAADSPDVIEPIAPMPEQRVPIYRSAMQVSSDCGVEKAHDPTRGFAPPSGGTPGEVPERNAKRLAVGAERQEVETDYERLAPGYVVVEASASKESLIVNADKETVASLRSNYRISHSKFDEDGNRTVNPLTNTSFDSGGNAGCLEEYSPQGELRWRIKLSTEKFAQHHDFFRMANGNVLALVWERAPNEEIIGQGRDPENVSEEGDFWHDGVIEINPYTQEIVWEWSTKHHLVQEFDPGKPNFGVVADHPELIDVNRFRLGGRDNSITPDWTHFNAIDYNAELDQIVLSVRRLSELWVIDHSTTPWESMRHDGGKQNRGGDLLYRWGNPEMYNRGTLEDKMLLGQHDVQWIRDGLPGAGNIIAFSNGYDEERAYSSIVEITPDMNPGGSYNLGSNGAYGPKELAWEYNPEPPERFYSWFIAGVQRLPNGNTLINQGAGAKIREVTPDGEIVWDYFYKGEFDAPYTMFRARKYPADNPGIAALIGRSSQELISDRGF